ncbi:MAG: carboxypeptidase-like regulatory domain-containing protein [Spirochaetia bacterium]
MSIKIRFIGTAMCFLAVLILCSCSHVADIGAVGVRSFKEASLSGIVLDDRGIPVPEADVILDGEQRTVTGVHGRFVFSGTGSGDHTVEVYAEAFEPMPPTRIRFIDRTDFLVLRIIPLLSLVDEAVEHLSRGSTDKADMLLARCEAAGGTPASRLLRGVFLYLTGDYAGALVTASDLIREGIVEKGAELLAGRCRQAQSACSNALP